MTHSRQGHVRALLAGALAVLLLFWPRWAIAAPVTIVALGDSLTAGFGLPNDQSLPAQLEKALRDSGHDVRIVNAGVSGDTASGGLARFDWAVGDDADAVIVALGANDALRGLPPEETRRALTAILDRIAARKLPVLIAGMEAPRNYGPDYTKAFGSMYPELAEKYGAVLYPFLLQDVATDAALNQDDGLHPNQKGVAHIVERLKPKVEELLAKVRPKP